MGAGHGTPGAADRRWLTAALGVIVSFMIVEVVVGFLAHSLALLSDAAHMLTDAGAIGLALWAIRLAARPPAGRMTYGWKRAEILSAQANGITLLVLAAWLAYEAVRRLISPPEVAGAAVLATALAGVGVNLAATWMIGKADRSSLNVEGAFQHILNDLFAFIATAAAGLVVLITGFDRADGIATLVVVGLMVKAGAALVRESSRVFLEAAPAGTDPQRIGREMAARPFVTEVHDLHVWEITSGQPALSAHVLVRPGEDCHAVRDDLAALLSREHGIAHATLQVDHAAPDVLTLRAPGISGSHCAGPQRPADRPPPR